MLRGLKTYNLCSLDFVTMFFLCINHGLMIAFLIDIHVCLHNITMHIEYMLAIVLIDIRVCLEL